MTKSKISTFVKAEPERGALILAGAGHAHLIALRQWLAQGWRAPAGSVLVSAEPQSWYSGMMPGLIAGRFTAPDCAVPLQALCEGTGFELYVDELLAVDAARRQVQLASGRNLTYTWLSLNTGSLPPVIEHSDGSIEQVAAKPFPTFVRHLDQWLAAPPVAGIAVVGGGAAAFELAMALRKRLASVPVSVLSGQALLTSLAAGARRRAIKRLTSVGIRIYENSPVTHISGGCLLSANEILCKAAVAILATGASALPWYRHSGLAVDDSGFLRVAATLQAVNHPEVFVSGDAASGAGSQRSGVYSVRHGEVLARNIPACINQQPLIEYQPQQRALALLSTGDGDALMSYAGLSGDGRLLGWWKDYLDRSFIRKHRRSV